MKEILYKDRKVFILDEETQQYNEVDDYEVVLETLKNNKIIRERNRTIDNLLHHSPLGLTVRSSV